MKATLWLILISTLGGIGFSVYQGLNGSGDLYRTLTQVDATIRLRFWHVVSWWGLLAWAVVVGMIEGVDYRSRHLFGGYQRGLMRLSVPLLAGVVGLGVVSLVWMSWLGLVLQLVMVVLVGLASFTLVAGRPLLR